MSAADPTTRAAELGAEHGRTAAKAWWERAGSTLAPDVLAKMDDPSNFRRGFYGWPRPDLGIAHPARATVESWGAYREAFTAAVETTIRERCEGVKS